MVIGSMISPAHRGKIPRGSEVGALPEYLSDLLFMAIRSKAALKSHSVPFHHWPLRDSIDQHRRSAVQSQSVHSMLGGEAEPPVCRLANLRGKQREWLKRATTMGLPWLKR
jgi:hypothetical protein